MKIYFSVSISQLDEELKVNCNTIVSTMYELGHSVINDAILSKTKNAYESQSTEEAIEAQKSLTKLKKKADLVVVEVSKSSIGLGQEIALALSMNKPVIALYRDGVDPHLLRDEGGDLLLLARYNQKNLRKVLEDAIEYASSHQDVRFNFFISPAIGQYLDWISQSKKIPRSVYLRNLIEKDMEQSEDYS